MNRRAEIDWGGKPVYPRLSINGILVALLPDGTVKAASGHGRDPVSIAKLSFGDSGRPWHPTHRQFNKTVKQMYREGDFDDLVREREASIARHKALRQAAPMLLEFANFIAERHPENTVEGDAARTVIRIARGEQ